jgi:hypothetical protein
MVNPIATPIGLFMAGYSGAGGDYIPLKAITRDIFQRLPNGIIFGLQIEKGAEAPKQSSMIIDVIFDGEANVRDPHIVEMVTDYPVDVANKGMVFFGVAKVPGYTRYSQVGKHTVMIKVAPRAPPVDGQPMAPRDFSAEAGGRIGEFAFTITKGPIVPQSTEE